MSVLNAVPGLLIAIVILSGCSASDTIAKTGEGKRTLPTLPEPPMGSSSSAWSNSSEYRASNGLSVVRAAQGYAARTTGMPGGQGRTVAILDTPVDISHAELGGETYSFVSDPLDLSDPNNAHGSHVAGIVAANRDGTGMHGIAYNAALKGIAVLRSVPRQRAFVSPMADTPSDVAAGIASAAGLSRSYPVYDMFGRPVYQINPLTGLPAINPLTGLPIIETKESNRLAGADVMNLSLGSPDPQRLVLGAMRDAAGAGRIMIAALGNCGQPFQSPQCRAFSDFDGFGPSSAPAAYVTDTRIAGYAIAVGALDPTGRRRASFSNACGEVRQFCLFAPGSDIYSTVPGGGYANMSGTSMASPIVAGAAAVVWSAFPNKSARQVVSRLLTTARPIDGRSISSVFGHGVLDLEAALQPHGTLSLSVPDINLTPLANTYLHLPTGFSAPTDTTNLAGAIVYDEQMFPFVFDLGTAFRGAATSSSDAFSRWFLSSLGYQSDLWRVGQGATAQFVYGTAQDATITGPLPAGDRRDESGVGISLHFAPQSNLRVSLGNMANAAGFSNGVVVNRVRRGVFRDDLSASPFGALAGSGVGLDVGWELDKNSIVDLLGMTGHGYLGSADTLLTSIGLTRNMGTGVTVGTRYGVLTENGSRMGVRAEGALRGPDNAKTQFVDLSIEKRVSQDLAVFAGASYGTTNGASREQGSLISKWGTAKAEAFSIGSEWSGIWSKSDHLTLIASLPFRARDAHVTVDVPTEEIADGIVRYSPHSVSLVPEGREKRLQFVYEATMKRGLKVSTGGFARIQPNHDVVASSELGVAAKIDILF